MYYILYYVCAYNKTFLTKFLAIFCVDIHIDFGGKDGDCDVE